MKITAEGSDSVGKFQVDLPGTCGVCHTNQDVVVSYKPLHFWTVIKKEWQIDPKKSNLNAAAKMGVTCGCYAKFHRQVAHIRDKMSKKK